MGDNYFETLCQLYPEKRRYLDWIKLYLDNRVYNYGNHNKFPSEGIRYKYALKSKLFKIKNYLKNETKNISKGYEGSILSNAYSTLNYHIINDYKIKVMPFPWSYRNGEFSKKDTKRILDKLTKANFKDFLDDQLYSDVCLLYEEMKSFLDNNKIRMVICYNDMYPLERMTIDAAKEVGIPTVVFLHGLPGRYDIIDDNRADYLCVWGKKIKEQYVKVGFNPNKIIVTGHPAFSNSNYPDINHINLSKPLVLTLVGCGVPSNSAEYIIGDRGRNINYAWTVEGVLKALGIKQATLRPHPSEDPDWYKKFVDVDFYRIDKASLSDSLKSASAIIGPTSTVSMDAARFGIPYFGFLQLRKDGERLVPPFDGTDPNFPVAFTSEQLLDNLKQGKCMKPEVFNNYLGTSFNIDQLLQLIEK